MQARVLTRALLSMLCVCTERLQGTHVAVLGLRLVDVGVVDRKGERRIIQLI
jgi:hypothetical protein